MTNPSASLRGVMVGSRPIADIDFPLHRRLMLARDDKEHPIPEGLRARFRELVAVLAAQDFQPSNHSLDGVAPIDARLADFIAEQINAYGATLAPLSEKVWERSV